MSEHDDDSHDVRLWRALEHAPDHGAVPDWRLRKAILKEAHDAIGEPDPADAAADLEKAAQSWWQHLSGSGAGGRRSGKPWPIVLVLVLVAGLAVVLWRREPVPGPVLDEKPQGAASRAEAQAPPASAASSASTVEEPPRDPASIPLLPPSFFASSAPPPVPTVSPQPPPPPSKAQSAALADMPLPPLPPLPPPQRQLAPNPGPLPQATRSSPKEEAALAPQGSTNVARAVLPPAPVPAAAPAAANTPPPSVRTEATDPPTFDALLQWTRITITRRGGESRSLPRAEAREVSALLGSAALSAAGPQPLKGAPEWRVTLERGADVLAVFEVAGPQVRWREGTAPAATGIPSAGSLAALREALGSAVQPTQAAAPAEAPRAP